MDKSFSFIFYTHPFVVSLVVFLLNHLVIL
nr:MAG TPA: hypothetical protein [Caudoviricetes sp.]